jgi:transcriptional regulator with XRE-family HTH domain
MDSKKIGNFIGELRKEKGMTQKELADRLNVTDKAVSKWERGAGYPEITIIPQLADLLGVSSGELLQGERNTESKTEDDTQENPPVALIADTIEYVNQYKSSKAGRIALVSMTLFFLLAAFVCMLCNYIIDKTFSWSLYVVGSEIVAWLIVYPFLAGKKHRFVLSLTALTVTIMPLLMLIEYLCPAKGWVFPFGLVVVLISLVSLWITVYLFVYTRINRWYLSGFACILYGGIVNIAVTAATTYYLALPGGDISNFVAAASSVFLGAVLAVVGYLKRPAKRS